MTKRCILCITLSLGFIISSAYADGGGLGRDDSSITSTPYTRKTLTKEVRLGDANHEETTEAVAHFARARSLIIAALHEFDRGRKIASPNDLLDSSQWRNTLIDRAEDLDRVLDPQPRATKGGIRFEADRRLLPEADK